MKDTPKVVTPTAASTIGTPNPFAALAETPDSEAEAETEAVPTVAESVRYISDNDYLPNQVITEEVNPEANTTTTTAISIEISGQPTTASVSEANTPLLKDSDNISLRSISTMGSSDIFDNDALSKAKISSLMERIQLDGTKATKAHTHTNIANFQEIMGHALVTLPSDKSKFGCSFLVDSNE